jgi:hypothetical protein
VTLNGYGIQFGSLDWSEAVQHGDVQVHVYDLNRGEPGPVVRLVESLMQDVQYEVVDGWSNRDQQVLIGVTASTPDLLSTYDELLHLETQKGLNTLEVTPPGGVTTVFDVLWSSMGQVQDEEWDLDELEGERFWQVTFRAAAWGRSKVLVVDEAISAGSGADASLNSCDSLTGWSTGGGPGTLELDTVIKFEGAASVRLSGGDVTYSPSSVSPDHRQETRSGVFQLDGLTENLTDTPFVSVKIDSTISTVTARMFVDDVEVDLVSTIRTGNTGQGWTAFVFDVPDAAAAKIRLEVTRTALAYKPGTAEGWAYDTTLRIDDSRKSPSQGLVMSSTGRELVRNLKVRGSAPTPGSLEIAHDTQGLGHVLVYSNPALAADGYTPDLRRWRVTGPVVPTADAALISGFTSVLGDRNVEPGTADDVPEVIEVPVDILPRGSYQLLVRAYQDNVFTDVQIKVSAKLANGTVVASRTIRNQSVPMIGGFYIFTADLTLPLVDAPAGSDAMIRFEFIDMARSQLGERWDEMFLLHMDDEDAALTIVACGEGTAALGAANSRLWIDAPMIGNRDPEIWVGTLPGRQDAYHAGQVAAAWNIHTTRPPVTPFFVANSGGANPTTRLLHYPRWHTNARKVTT